MKIFFFVGLIFLSSNIFGQKCVVSGFVANNYSGEIIIGANIFEQNSKKGVATNNLGYYSLMVNVDDTLNLKVSFIGYKTIDTTFFVNTDTEINFSLSEQNQIKDIAVYANKKQNIGEIETPIAEIEIMPSLTGEKDVLKAYQLMPGVQTGSEGASSLHVRGGSPDQNLILIDDVHVYYINHIGGFVSVFDENAINKLTLIKGGFPARYGGRLSSVVDIRLKDGDLNHFHGEFSVGLIASRFFLEGPLQKNKTSFFVSARRSNIDLISKPITWLATKSASGYTFYDLNLKIRHKINHKNTVFLTSYFGNDNISLTIPSQNSKSKMQNGWGNIVTSLKWNTIYSNKLTSNTTFAYTRFYYSSNLAYKETENNELKNNFEQQHNIGVQDLILKSDFDLFLNSTNSIKFGAGNTFRFFNPGEEYVKMVADTTINLEKKISHQKLRSNQTYAYIEDNITFLKIIDLNIGTYISAYTTDKKTFYSIQPRILGNIELFKNINLQGSYTQMQQNLHLFSNNTARMPFDLWMPANTEAKPENSTQYTAGAKYIFGENSLEISAEGFYKTQKNLIELDNQTTPEEFENSLFERIETGGKSKIYGLEFLLQKKVGRFTGWLSYTWSRNYRKFPEFNQGLEYPYIYDRRHDFSTVANYKLAKNATISSTWIYMSGSPITLGVSKYDVLFQNVDVVLNSTVNNYRMPDYHRLDFAVNFVKQKKHGKRTLSLSVYNLYNRKNPYLIFFGRSANSNLELKKFSLFPIIPSISYSFKF